jgi:predicted nucleotidyltransferase
MGLLDEKILKQISEEIEEQFPEMKGVEPLESRISTESDEKIFEKLGLSMPKTFSDKEIIRLIYKKSIRTEDGFTIQRIVRVLTDKEGTILKVSTSK